MKYSEINTTTYLQDIHEENCKLLMKEIEGKLNKWSDGPCSWIGSLNIVKMSVLSNLIYKLYAHPNKSTIDYFVDIENDSEVCIERGKNKTKNSFIVIIRWR
jgi:hypothetical protein